MYQFPDSPPEAPDVLKNSSASNKSNRLRIIIAANLTLAIFVAGIVWILFFFNSDGDLTNNADLSLPKREMTPIILGKDTPLPLTPQITKEIQTITPVEEEVFIREADNTPNKKLAPATYEKVTETPKITKTSKNTTDTNKTEETKDVVAAKTPKQEKIAPQTVVKPVEIETQQDIETTKPMSAIDAITQELLKSQNKTNRIKEEKEKPASDLQKPSQLPQKKDEVEPKKPTATTSDESTTIKVTTKAQQIKDSSLGKNQIEVGQSKATPLSNLVKKAKEDLNSKDKVLINKLGTLTTKKTADTAPPDDKKKQSNADIYNSISIKKASDIDKIMAAMGHNNNSEKTNSIKGIEDKVGKLLDSEKGKYRKTDQYVETLKPESDYNSKEMRTITVKEDEELWDVAVRAYGDGDKYKIILEANPLLKEDPKLLKAGITLRVPLLEDSKSKATND